MGLLEYVVTERMDRHKFETVDMQNNYCWIGLTSIHRSFSGAGYLATNTECTLRDAQTLFCVAYNLRRYSKITLYL